MYLSLPVFLSKIDEEHFGIKVAKANNVSLDILPLIINFCKSNKVKLLIARVLCTDLLVVNSMESKGFELKDTLIYYKHNLFNIPNLNIDKNIIIRPAEKRRQRKN